MYIKLKEIEKLKNNENPNIEAEDIFKQLFSELKDIDTKKALIVLLTKIIYINLEN